jgi:tryptophanyl-tRNA synthetase
MQTSNTRPRILTGIRPTGRLHLGHYVGALENWVRLQDEYDSTFLIADYQALADHADEVEGIRRAVIDVTLDWLAVGLDPKRSTFAVQSYVPEHAELAMLLGMLVPLGRLQRNPTLKAEMSDLRTAGQRVTAGFYTYPISQVADILVLPAQLVPVGDDQMPYIELTREVARTFNRRYGETFPVPDGLVGRVARLVGTDGTTKMSKSRGNVIDLADDTATVRRKVMAMYTDPTRASASDPGHVEGNAVFAYLDAFGDSAEVAELKDRYTAGRIGDVALKDRLAQVLETFLEPIRERRAVFEAQPEVVGEMLAAGSEQHRRRAEETMRRVRDAMGISRYGQVLIP